VSRSIQVSDSRIPETLVLCIDRATSSKHRSAFIEQIEPILPHLSWRTHIFIVSHGASNGVPDGVPHDMEFTRQIIQSLARFLVENRFASFYVHPVIDIGIGPPDTTESARWNEILSCARPFQQQAYDQQTEARLLILPIIEPAVSTADGRWMQAVQFFHASVAKPSVVLRGPAALEKAQRSAGQEVRFYIERDEQSGARGLIRQLWMNNIFEDLLERVKVAAEGSDLLLPCRTHRVIDQRSNRAYTCFHDWSLDRPFDTLENISRSGAGITGNCKPDACAGCISRSLCAMTDNLIANSSRSEGRKVHFQLALAFTGTGRDHEAIEHATRARDLASIDTDRASASIIKGLCHLGLRELAAAEQTLEEAAASAEDPGLVSFHRGRVQFEWRDYIEALDRFEEALASGSQAVPEVDLFYYMAVSHVHIQEYPQARSYLDRWGQTGQRRATMFYYRGLCDIGEEKFESALSELQASENAGPAQQDMGNTLFYTGSCLKELCRYEEAIAVLKRAAESDPDEIDTFNLLGFCFYKTARHTEAVDCFRRAIALDPRSAIDHANLATNLRQLGRTEEAIAFYRKALSLDPNIGFARDALRRLTDEPDGQE
jgi:tetratricopeptide (TPR) repeat protein